MEGAGSRLGRASSRYGQQPPSSSPANFTGPVRRWEKKWVHVSSLHRSRPSSITRHHQKPHPPTPTPNPGPGVLLCKWTPLSHPPAPAHNAVLDPPLTPPRRKFRYTPIAVLEEKKREVVKMVQSRAKSGEEEERKMRDMSDDDDDDGDDDSFDGLLNINQGPVEAGHQVHNESFSTPRYVKTRLNLEIPLKAQEDSPDPGW